MPYVGRSTDKISNVEVLDNITFDGSSSYTLQKNSVNFTPSSANTLLVSIDGVVQAGNFTVSGSTIDFGTAVAGTSTCDFILHYGVGLITTPADGTVSLDKLSATGTKDATTFLRGDNTFAAAGGGFESQQVFTSSGTYTKPSGINTIKVIVVGGGGGGGTHSTNSSAGGGGGGGASIKVIDATAITTETVTVGAGGTGGNSGGTSSFGSHCSATGGATGSEQFAGDNTTGTGAGGVGGVGSGGDININGEAGQNNLNLNCGGKGGSSILGGGGRVRHNTGGDNGGNYGGGGGGAGDNSTVNSAGTGGSGIVIVEEYK